MGIMSNTDRPKRKACIIDSLLETKRFHNIQQLQKELDDLVEKKKEFQKAQKRASLFVDVRQIDELSLLDEFSTLYKRAESLLENGPKKNQLLERIIKESIIIEWPRSFPGVSDQNDVDIDFAPLIHRARNVVKCRTSHPTMRVKICAIKSEKEESLPNVEVLYRASLVKLTGDNCDAKGYRQVAGRMILTQREGIPFTKTQEQSGAVVNASGKLVAYQSNAENNVFQSEEEIFPSRIRLESGFLCATFPEMGVTLNSMIDRRQLSTRYAIQVEILLSLGSLSLKHIIVSHPFLIAITNDQTEPLLQSIFWHRLIDCDQYEPTDIDIGSQLQWKILRQSIRAIVKCQMPSARFLYQFELNHIQCMILLPRIIRLSSIDELKLLEMAMFGNTRQEKSDLAEEKKRLRNRLLTEPILDYCVIDRSEFMTDKCISILDMSTELPHSTWNWLHRASEMIQDVGHKLCPSPSVDKKSTKTKKQMAAAEDYQTILSLFNKGLLTFCSIPNVIECFSNEKKSSMMLRFCDENSSHFSFCYGLENGKPIIGSISSDQVKEFKQGLPEVLIDERQPSKFTELVRLSTSEEELICTTIPKHEIFHNYTTQRRNVDSVAILDDETCRVDVLSGAHLARATPPPSHSQDIYNSIDLTALFNNNEHLNQLLNQISQSTSKNTNEQHNGSSTSAIENMIRTVLSNDDETTSIAQMLLNQCD